jgi:hypothetical protein
VRLAQLTTPHGPNQGPPGSRLGGFAVPWGEGVWAAHLGKETVTEARTPTPRKGGTPVAIAAAISPQISAAPPITCNMTTTRRNLGHLERFESHYGHIIGASATESGQMRSSSLGIRRAERVGAVRILGSEI